MTFRTVSSIVIKISITLDPSFERDAQRLTKVAENSYVDTRGNYFTYLVENEILRLFNQFQVIHHWEGMGLEHQHAGGQSHRHGMIEAVFQC
ncbi:hypothetical protein ACFL27_18835 [candidate division CSSED10-310 bacterium]|uniref:Uncharacterized protein n=1 Tax=candidate division CSSED10-310 bacterium TaxID=2855610 RepID=A0ABV6Z1E3_UNCC1